jgi:hypothetical protein
MTTSATSKNGIVIRLTDECWAHITDEHGELEGLESEVLAAVTNPVRILEGNEGELLAVRELALGKYVVVVYRELDDDGFVITAFVTRRIRWMERRKQLWP